jgi:K+-sensing histidine kinase KdpD
VNLLDRALRRIQRVLTVGVAAPPPDRAPVPVYPGQARRRSAASTVTTIAVAVLLPIGFGIALVPLRDHLSQSISLLMVLPVLVVALLAGGRLGALAGLAAAVTFGVLHTEPYHLPVIDDADDLVETLVLLVIGVSSGYLAESAQRAVAVARVRRHELAAMTSFLERVGTSPPTAELVEHAGASILSVLSARECVWRPGYKGSASPVLRLDGTLAFGPLAHPAEDGGRLPTTIEIPAGHPPSECGRFIVRTDPSVAVSLEERRAAATIAIAVGRCIDT